MNKWKELLISKKFRVATLTFVLMLLNKLFGFDINIEEAVLMVSPFIAYILGQGVADLNKNKES